MNRKLIRTLGWCGTVLAGAGVVAACVAAVTSSAHEPAATQDSDAYVVKGDTIRLSPDTANHAGIRELTVESRQVPLTLTLTARTGLNMEKVTHVHAQFGGKVINVGPQLGATVNGPDAPGGPTVLCVIESNDLAQAKANWIQSEVQLKLDEEALVRTRELVKSTVLAPKFLIDAESAVTKDRASMEAARQQLLIFGLSQKEIDQVDKQVGRQRMDYVVSSPRTGVIAEKGVAGGEIADPSITLFTVADTSAMWVWGDVYERDLQWVKVGQSAKVYFTSEPNRIRECRIDWISPTLDPNTHSIRIRGTLQNTDGHLLADMYGTMVVTVREGQESIVIPSDAVVRQDENAFVLVRQQAENGQTVYRRTSVKIEPVGVGFGASGGAASAAGSAVGGQAAASSLRITQGLRAGDVIVQNGTLGLFNEMQQQARNQ